MPGLFGFINNNGRGVQSDFLDDMMNSLKHFNWYKTDRVITEDVGAGVVATCAGNFCAEEEGILVAISGEIYGVTDRGDNIYLSEGNVDISAVVRLYRKYGDRLPEKLNGKFNIFLFDKQNKISLLFNDHFGHQHLYIYRDSHVILFSPEIKAFLLYDKFDNILDDHGISDYFVYFYQFSDRTFFKNVKLFPPASIMKIESGRVSLETYWKPVYSNSRTKKHLDDSVMEGFRLFEQSVNRCLGNAQDILVPLSGGLDSRLIMAVAAKRDINITSVTFGAEKCLDYRIACKVTSMLNLPAPMLIPIGPEWLKKYAYSLVHLGECSYGALGITTQHGMADSVSGDFDVVLNGIYGGHLSFGSPYYSTVDLETEYSPTERVCRIRKGFNGHRFFMSMKDVVSSKLKDMVHEYADKTIEKEWKRSEEVSDRYWFRQDYIFLYNRIRRGMNNINQNKFFFNDKQPFASYELFNFYLSLSTDLTMHHHLYKEIYKRFLPELAKIPWQQTGVNLFDHGAQWSNFKRTLKRYCYWYLKKFSRGRLSYFDHDQYDNQDIAYRKNKDVREWAEKILLSDRCLDRGYFRRHGVKELLQKEMAGHDLFYEIGKMVMFELWAREFLDKEGI